MASEIKFKRLTEVKPQDLIQLMNNPLVKRQMPLLTDSFSEKSYHSFIAAKESLWRNHGYGPWAFYLEDSFIGWGGLQPEDGDADLALVLHPNYWGMGKVIYEDILRIAFNEMGLASVTILFPPTRTRIKGILKLGFQKDREVFIDKRPFIRYRLRRPSMN